MSEMLDPALILNDTTHLPKLGFAEPGFSKPIDSVHDVQEPSLSIAETDADHTAFASTTALAPAARPARIAPPIRGEFTRVDLTQTAPFTLAPELDAWGRLRPPLSRDLMRLSLELSIAAYDLNVDRFLRAGWVDCTFQLENRAVSLYPSIREKRLASLQSGLNLYRAKMWMRASNPVSDLKRAMQQFQATDTGKSVVMARPLPEGRAVIAVSFIGTSRKFYDWFSNFKFQLRNGMHAGFMDLAHQFESYEEAIQFPEIAAHLGRETLTLRDVIESLKTPGGPFTLWISGHSQGGAVAQTYLHILKQRGVTGPGIVGFAYASPKVAAVGAVEEPSDYPLYHILSTDDPVTCMGAQIRLGVDLVFQPDDSFRVAHYGWPVSGQKADAVEAAARILRNLQTVESSFLIAAGLLRMLREHPDAKGLPGMLQMLQRIPQAKLLTDRAGTYMEEWQRRLLARVEAGYTAYMGGPIPDEAIRMQEMAWREAVQIAGGMEAFMDILRVVITPVHGVGKIAGKPAPYIVIAQKHVGELAQGCWEKDAPARCLTADGEHLLPLLAPETLQMPRMALRKA